MTDTKHETNQNASQTGCACRPPKTYVNYIGHERRALFGWYALNSDGIVLLLNLLAVESLDPMFEETLGYDPAWLYPDSDHAKSRSGMRSYSGNFLDISCAFNIDTRDPGLIKVLDAAIRANQATADYRAARADWEEREGKRLACFIARKKEIGQQRPEA